MWSGTSRKGAKETGQTRKSFKALGKKWLEGPFGAEKAPNDKPGSAGKNMEH